MKKVVALLIAVMCLGLFAACTGAQPVAPAPVETAATEAPTEEPSPTEEPAAAEKDYARLITEIPADADIETALKLENRNYKHIQAMKVLFSEDSYSTYNKAVTKMKKDRSQETVDAALAAREALEQVYSVEERLWFIWDGTTMPMVDGEELTEEDIDTSQMFGYGFEPFVIKYLLDDPSTAKGNIVAVSGGAMLVWSNGSEGYPAAKVFNDLGYNYFLLQRRVGPYAYEDICMDYQRVVRVVRYHAEAEGYGHTDMIAGLGWSGGSGTLMGSVLYLYGDILPTIYDSDYVPDEIDTVSADLDVAMPIYGGDWIPLSNNYPSTKNEALVNPDLVVPIYTLVRTIGNTNLPAFYIVHGTGDSIVPSQASVNLYEAVKDLVPAQLNLIEGAGHGFGVGLSPATGQAPGTDLWPALADAFMQANLGFQKNR